MRDELILESAFRALCIYRPFEEARLGLPEKAGLYAIYGDAATWNQLGLAGCDKRPLYVGKTKCLGSSIPKSCCRSNCRRTGPTQWGAATKLRTRWGYSP